MEGPMPPLDTTHDTLTRRELHEELSSDRRECLMETLAPHATLRTEILDLLDEISDVAGTVENTWGSSCSDPGRDRIDASRQATMSFRAAAAALRCAVDYLEEAK
jgi:hypothetical protein